MILLRVDNWLAQLYQCLGRFLPSFMRRIMPSWTLVSFGLSSCGCMIIDKTVFTAVCLPLQSVSRSLAIATAIVVARLVSGHCNYFYNQNIVFKSTATWASYAKYWGLVAINMTLSMATTEFISAKIDAYGFAITIVNLCVDVMLFVFSFVVQKLFIFKRSVGA